LALSGHRLSTGRSLGLYNQYYSLSASIRTLGNKYTLFVAKETHHELLDCYRRSRNTFEDRRYRIYLLDRDSTRRDHGPLTEPLESKAQEFEGFKWSIQSS